MIENGIISEIKITAIKGVKPLSVQELKHFKVFLKYFAEKIVEKWVKYFVYHEEIEFERITKRLEMRIIEEKSDGAIQSVKVEKAKYIGNYTIQVHFNDKTERMVDFKPFLTKAQHPSIKKYLSEDLFAKYKVIDGNLNWNDYDLIFPVWELYKGKIIA